jgi:hypothetical protein
VRGSRFPSALAAALCVHTALLAVAVRHRAVARESVAPTTLEEVFDVSEEPTPAPVPPTTEPESVSAAPAKRPLVARGPEAATSAVAEEPFSLVVAPDAPLPPSPQRADAPPVNLGIGDYWKRVAIAGAEDGVASPDGATPWSDDMLRAPLDARDRAMGLGAAGPLVSVAHDAASPSLAPDVGTATLEIECDATGKAVTARVLYADAELGAWDDVAKALLRLAADKRVHLPRGAHGLRAQLRIVAERALPSGEKRTASAGAAPDDVCDGTGVNRRCAAGMPTGVSGTWGDLANIGAKRSRIVHVRVVDEEAL